jgi:hypothetical protein
VDAKYTRNLVMSLILASSLLGLRLAASTWAEVLQGADGPQQSRTGPEPPLEVLKHDTSKLQDRPEYMLSETTLPVPAYLWRHGCGPTAVGMIVGYYDAIGYPDLIPGSAFSQTTAVNQAIASGGNSSNPYPPGSERHYEDYARPQDASPNLLTDDYLVQGRTSHTSDCIADFMDTSKSTRSNYYGWSWSSDVGPSFVNYVNLRNTTYGPSYTEYRMSDGVMTWSRLTSEINAGRPMVFLVDTDGNAQTDHLVAVIGYRTSPGNQYACWDTWYTTVRYENFSGMSSGVPWGIWGGWALKLNHPPDTPSLISPVNGATDVNLTPTLQASAFYDPDSDFHANTQWQVDNNSDFTSPEWDSGESYAASTQATVPSGRLSYSTNYYWRVCYKDNRGAWSDWSSSRFFTTISIGACCLPDNSCQEMSAAQCTAAGGAFRGEGTPCGIDTDGDGVSDVCDDDDDGDGVPDVDDNCPLDANANQADKDGDGVGDVCDACPGTMPGALVDERGCALPIPGDFDRDGDVDQEDFGHLQACMTGDANPVTDPACFDARLDGDSDVDMADFAIFYGCMSGADMPADPNCAE